MISHVLQNKQAVALLLKCKNDEVGYLRRRCDEMDSAESVQWLGHVKNYVKAWGTNALRREMKDVDYIFDASMYADRKMRDRGYSLMHHLWRVLTIRDGIPRQ